MRFGVASDGRLYHSAAVARNSQCMRPAFCIERRTHGTDHGAGHPNAAAFLDA